jgi:hypothetical protein
MSKLIVSPVPVGNYEVEGLMCPDTKKFYVSASQIAEQFSLPKNHATRDIKALLGADSQLPKIKTELNPVAATVVTLEEYQLCVKALVTRGNTEAINFVNLLFGLSLEQLFSDAFNIKFDKLDRQHYLQERTIHRDNYLDTFCIWTKLDGGDNLEYVKRLSSLKKKAGLPGNLSVHQMNEEQLKRINTAESFYNGLRKSGKSHTEVMTMLPFMF